jgi:hypothetical protein
MSILLRILVSLVAAAAMGTVLYIILCRIEAQLVSRGVVPTDPWDRIYNFLTHQSAPTSDEQTLPADFSVVDGVVRRNNTMSLAEAMASIRRMPTAFAETMTMREHMQVVDVHLLRAQDYVVALGADENGAELAGLFKKIRLTRKALRIVAQGITISGDLPQGAP